MITTPAAPLQRPHLRTGARYRVEPHPHHARLYHVVLDPAALIGFFDAVKNVDHQNLEYVPYMRFVVAARLDAAAGAGFADALRAIVRDRDSGGFTAGVNGATSDSDDFVKFATAVGHLLGPANFDAMQGTYYARFSVQHDDASDSYLRQAYRTMTLHTDGTYVDDVTDWLLMMKFAERNAAGGESRLLHLDDWAELRAFSDHPLASHGFLYTSPPSKNVATSVRRRTFFPVGGKPCLCFIDQFVYPETIAEAMYLHDLSASMEASPSVTALPLPAGDLVVLNNAFWAHGRAPFEPHPDLHRELLRQRGRFA